ncbi:DNA-processing protein DprA [Corynebacterium sp. LK2590]|uniref:DNA-processing protein DprA n=1 Tax=unclassified Corynebacterium TaxID=2624378 RepID=UPI0034CE52AF
MSDFHLRTELDAWVYLNRVVEGPSRHLAALLAEYPVDEVAHGVYHARDWIGPLLRQTASRRDWLRQDEDLAAARSVGARLITPEDPEWPCEEFGSAFGFFGQAAGEAPASFDAEAVAPHSLWVRGGSLRQAVQESVALVGTRAMSRYGYEATQLLTRDLCQHHVTVVSGGALGIDTTAHQQALDSGGLTVAVAACGIDYPYPARNEPLFNAIAARGVMVSEYPPGTTPQRHRFLTRNRLVAALTAGTVVVEASFRSGALNTANWAEALGKVVMAVPGPITGRGSVGCHLRIQEQRAQLVANAEQIRELISPVGQVDAGEQFELDFAASPTQRLSRNELRVYDAVPPSDRAEGARAQDIAREAGMRLPLAIHLLVALEKQQLVRRQGNLWVRDGLADGY